MIVTNSTSSERAISARYLTPDVPSKTEQTYVIRANALLRVDLRAESPSAVSLLIESNVSGGLGFRVEFEFQGITGFQLTNLASQSLILDIPAENTLDWAGVAISNLGETPDELTISAYGENGNLLGVASRSVSLHGVIAQLVAELFPGVDSIAYLHVEGENRLLGMTLSRIKAGSFLSYPAHPGSPKVLDPNPDFTYFLVGYPKFGVRTSESYVIALLDPEHIAQARKMLADPSERKIVVGSIDRGHGGHNRNLTEVGQSAYSWHVDQFQGFADFAVEICDGGPMSVEFDLAYWIETVGQICFWTPTVVRELTVEEVRTGVLGE
ncbi:hypothetical protein MYX84_16210 [Acidobacteria bacterium AH-259-O06]|nr:hypothetical protein [Acidobacteria bacterium AH-259-O06]